MGRPEFFFLHAYYHILQSACAPNDCLSTLAKCQPTGALQSLSPHNLIYVNSPSTLLQLRQMTLSQLCLRYWILSYHLCLSTYQHTLHRSSGFVTAFPHHTLRKPFTTSSFSSTASVLSVGVVVKMMGTAARLCLVCESLELPIIPQLKEYTLNLAKTKGTILVGGGMVNRLPNEGCCVSPDRRTPTM